MLQIQVNKPSPTACWQIPACFAALISRQETTFQYTSPYVHFTSELSEASNRQKILKIPEGSRVRLELHLTWRQSFFQAQYQCSLTLDSWSVCSLNHCCLVIDGIFSLKCFLLVKVSMSLLLFETSAIKKIFQDINPDHHHVAVVLLYTR